MPTLNYAEQWRPELVETMIQETLCSPFITSNVRFLDAKTFHFTSMSVTGYKTHNRQGGWNTGNFKQTDHPFTLAHDRDISFLIDKADVDESNATATAQNVSVTFEQQQAAPEADALFFSTVASKAQELEGYHSSSAAGDWTKATVYGKLKSMIGAGKLRRYKAQGALVCYVASFIMDLLEQCDDFSRKIEVTQIAEGGAGIETRITDIDGVTLIEVIDDERFYDKFDFESENGGFVPATGGHKIHVLVASPLTCKYVDKISSIYFFDPGAHTEGDGYLYQNRKLSGAFVLPNGKDGKIDSVYVDVDTEAVA